MDRRRRREERLAEPPHSPGTSSGSAATPPSPKQQSGRSECRAPHGRSGALPGQTPGAGAARSTSRSRGGLEGQPRHAGEPRGKHSPWPGSTADASLSRAGGGGRQDVRKGREDGGWKCAASQRAPGRPRGSACGSQMRSPQACRAAPSSISPPGPVRAPWRVLCPRPGLTPRPPGRCAGDTTVAAQLVSPPPQGRLCRRAGPGTTSWTEPPADAHPPARPSAELLTSARLPPWVPLSGMQDSGPLSGGGGGSLLLCLQSVLEARHNPHQE